MEGKEPTLNLYPFYINASSTLRILDWLTMP